MRNGCINVALRHFHINVVAVEKQQGLCALSVCVCSLCSLIYPACTAHALYYSNIFGLPSRTKFFHTIS